MYALLLIWLSFKVQIYPFFYWFRYWLLQVDICIVLFDQSLEVLMNTAREMYVCLSFCFSLKEHRILYFVVDWLSSLSTVHQTQDLKAFNLSVSTNIFILGIHPLPCNGFVFNRQGICFVLQYSTSVTSEAFSLRNISPTKIFLP